MSVEGLEGVVLTLSGCLDREADERNALVCGAAMGRWLRWRCLRWVHTLSLNTTCVNKSCQPNQPFFTNPFTHSLNSPIHQP